MRLAFASCIGSIFHNVRFAVWAIGGRIALAAGCAVRFPDPGGIDDGHIEIHFIVFEFLRECGKDRKSVV
jgi:hypothetical protein